MRKILYTQWLCLLFILLNINVSCRDDKDAIKEGNGFSNQNWTTGQTYYINAEQTLTFSFTTVGSWTAQSSSSALLTLSTNAGNSGKNTLSVTAHNSSQTQATVTIQVGGYSSNNTIKIQLTKDAVADKEINPLVDDYLKRMYLWNDEYKTLTPDFKLDYDGFLRNTLMSMQTNTLDKKPNGHGGYSLFSNIKKLDPDLQSGVRNAKEPKSLTYNYGVAGVIILETSTNNLSLVVQSVYPGSSADKAGIKRGTKITHIDNQKLTVYNLDNYISRLLQPTFTSTIEVTDSEEKKYSISSAPIYANPILYHNVKNKIGYLVYNSFDAGFDQELLDVFKEFKRQDITDLILDLRYNGGGHVISANLMSSCIAGEKCKDLTFAEYRYNNERMRTLNNVRAKDKFAYSSYENLGYISLAAGGLNLQRVYCLVSNHTASASELVINSLRGIGMDVILIGTTTHGKNVGMEGIRLTTATARYELAPITFQSYNAKGEGDYEEGFTPDYTIDENTNGGKYFIGYNDFGADNEILYAKAVSLITGTKNAVLNTTRSASGSSGIPLRNVETGFIGMIK